MRRPVQVRSRNLKGLRGLFGRIREFGADPDELLDIWGALLEASTRTRFDTGQGPYGIPWPESYRARTQGGKTLVDKGNLEGSIRYETRPSELEVGVDGVGASSKHAATHQFGAVIRPVNANSLRFKLADGRFVVTDEVIIPARPFLGVDDDDRRDMKETAIEHLRSLVDGRP